MSRLSTAAVVLDNEAAQALLIAGHPKRAKVMSFLQEANERARGRRSKSRRPDVYVPVMVRVEAGWIRRQSGSAEINRASRATDVEVDTVRADAIGKLRSSLNATPIDASVLQAATDLQRPTTILTSDVDDMVRLASALDGEIRIERI